MRSCPVLYVTASMPSTIMGKEIYLILRRSIFLGTWRNHWPRANTPATPSHSRVTWSDVENRTHFRQAWIFGFAVQQSQFSSSADMRKLPLASYLPPTIFRPRHRKSVSPLSSRSSSLSVNPRCKTVNVQPARTGKPDRCRQAGARTRPLHIAWIGGGCRPKG